MSPLLAGGLGVAQGTTQEGTAVRCIASQESAMLNCENYTKDREEYDLDQERWRARLLQGRHTVS